MREREREREGKKEKREMMGGGGGVKMDEEEENRERLIVCESNKESKDFFEAQKKSKQKKGQFLLTVHKRELTSYFTKHRSAFIVPAFVLSPEQARSNVLVMSFIVSSLLVHMA